MRSKVKRNVFTVKLDASALELKLKTKESKNARMIQTASSWFPLALVNYSQASLFFISWFSSLV